MDNLITRRGHLRGRLTRLLNQVKALDEAELDHEDLEIRLEHLDQALNEYKVNQEKIYEECGESEWVKHDEYDDEVMAIHRASKSALLKSIRKLTAAAAAPLSTSRNDKTGSSIPTADGASNGSASTVHQSGGSGAADSDTSSENSNNSASRSRRSSGEGDPVSSAPGTSSPRATTQPPSDGSSNFGGAQGGAASNSSLLQLINQILIAQQGIVGGQPAPLPLAADPNTTGLRHLRLPTIKIKKFSGNYRDWIAFEDAFEGAFIQHSPKLSNAELLFHLKENVSDQPTVQKASYQAIRTLMTTSQEVIDSLGVLPHGDGEPPLLDYWLIHLLVNKLDAKSKGEWGKYAALIELPSLDDFFTFLRILCESFEHNRPASTTAAQPQTTGRQIKANAATTAASEDCAKYNGDHSLASCDSFRKLSVSERRELTKAKSLCLNCMRRSHSASKCRSTNSCRNCKARHHSLLCTGTKTQEQTNDGLQSNFTKPNVNCSILPTAVVQIKDRFGRLHLANCLIDTGTQATLISEELAQRLRLERSNARISVSGMGGAYSGVTRGTIRASICSRFDNNEAHEIQLYVFSRLVGSLPTEQLDIPDWPRLNQLPLADPNYKNPKPIDLVLGPDVLFRILRRGRLQRGGKNGQVALETTLGWIVSGSADGAVDKLNTAVAEIAEGDPETEIDRQLRRFWEVEEVDELWTAEEKVSEAKFMATFRRDDSGRFVVKLPIDESKPPLGDSFRPAFAALKALERRFARDDTLREKYSAFIEEYHRLGHMERVPLDEIDFPRPRRTFTDMNAEKGRQNPDGRGVNAFCPSGDDLNTDKGLSKVYYLPHHAVFKEDSTTTKLRVVFNASKPSSSGVSLNDRLHVGPQLQRDLITILLNFRLHRYVAAGDVEKMYRQILVEPEDSNLQRILWRPSPDAPLEHWRLTTVTYGTGSASYCATKPLMILADQHTQQESPRACEVIGNNFYVDDCMFGDDNLEEAIHTQTELIRILASGGFPLRKRAANHPRLLENVPPEHRELEPHHLDFDSDCLAKRKTLGIVWLPARDTFTYSVNLYPEKVNTKRKFLSESFKLFDPLGWVAPAVTLIKILFQELWRAGKDWDDELPTSVQRNWDAFSSQIKIFEDLHIPRWIPRAKDNLELYGFSDASMKEYAAVIYARTIDEDGNVQIRLIISKTRVAPNKGTTIPRLELCAAQLLSKLASKVLKAISPLSPKVFSFSDSTTDLAWLAADPRRWKVYVKNRCTEILDVLPRSSWHHVPGKDNPADLASRGVLLNDLMQSSLWWNGPTWLMDGNHAWENSPEIVENDEILQEMKPVNILANLAISSPSVLRQIQERYSSYSTMMRVTAYVRRFIHNRLNERSKWRTGYLILVELRDAEWLHIKLSQELHFPEEIKALREKKLIKRKSKILSLTPILEDDILRDGGRLWKAHIEHSRKHPIILHPKATLTALLDRHLHQVHLHAGPTVLLNLTRQKFWIVRSRPLVRQICHKCLICFRQKARPQAQIMGNLPSARIDSPPVCFDQTGVDFAGPIKLRPSSGRGNTTMKGYIVVFVCMASTAVSLELAVDLSAIAFLKAFKRFLARANKPQRIFSDNETNFTGAINIFNANKEKAVAQVMDETLANFLSNSGIEWQFNPPSARHMGGLWEAAVKFAKFHLNRTLQDQILTFEEFYTVLSEVEVCLNSRPLCRLTEDPSDFDALTPAHLFKLRPPTCLPEPALKDIKLNRLPRYDLLRRLAEDYWRRWRTEYISQLQQRTKWSETKGNLVVGDLVLILDDNAPPSCWPLGRVTETHPGKDGAVRVVSVRHKGGELRRPIVKLAKLPID